MLEPLQAYFQLLTQWTAKINRTSLPLDPPTDETFDRLLVAQAIVHGMIILTPDPIVASYPARTMW